MKKKRNVIIASIILAIFIVIGVVCFVIFRDNNKLTIAEQKWVNDNTKTVLNINVINSANVFGSNGEGVFYSFLNDFSKKYNLNVNPVTFSDKAKYSGITFNCVNMISDNDVIFYEYSYVLVGAKDKVILGSDDLKGKNIGILASDLSYLSGYLDTTGVNFKQYDTKDDLLKGMNAEVNYLMVPMYYYLDKIGRAHV